MTEILDCPVCKSAGSKIILNKKGYILKQCDICRLTYLSPRLSDVNKIYLDDTSSSASMYYINSKATDEKVFSRRLDILEKYTKKGKILDIGCSVGTFLTSCLNRGWKEAIGIEPNPVSAAFCSKNGLKVINDFFNDEFEEKDFDAVNLSDVIEHVGEPMVMLKSIYNKLKTGGALLVVTPDFDNLISQQLQFKPDEHILYFNKDSLTYSLEKAGFNVRFIESSGRERDIKALEHSTTFKSNMGKKFIKAIDSIGLDKPINYILRNFVKDEIIAVATK